MRLARADIAHKLGRFARLYIRQRNAAARKPGKDAGKGKPLAQEYFVVIFRVLEFQRQDARVYKVRLVDARKAFCDDGADAQI